MDPQDLAMLVALAETASNISGASRASEARMVFDKALAHICDVDIENS